MTDYPLMCVIRVTWPVFFKFASNHIFGIGAARQFEFRVLMETQQYKCMHDRLPPKRMFLESRDLVKFWEITGNISLTVQDRGIVTMEY